MLGIESLTGSGHGVGAEAGAGAGRGRHICIGTSSEASPDPRSQISDQIGQHTALQQLLHSFIPAQSQPTQIWLGSQTQAKGKSYRTVADPLILLKSAVCHSTQYYSNAKKLI